MKKIKDLILDKNVKCADRILLKNVLKHIKNVNSNFNRELFADLVTIFLSKFIQEFRNPNKKYLIDKYLKDQLLD